MFNEYKIKDGFFDKINNKNYKRNIIFIFIIISIIYIIPLSLVDVFSNDLSFHIHRIESIATNLKNGIILSAPQADNLGGWGYQLSVFYPSLFLYPAAFLTAFLKINALTAFYFLIFYMNLLSGFLGYICMYSIDRNKRASFYFALLCILNPYRIISLSFYGFVGSFLAATFVPVVIIGLYDLIENNKWKFLAIGMIGLLYSHLITTLLAGILVFIYCLFNIKSFIIIKNKTIQLLKAVVFSFIGCLGFLVPFVYYYKSDTFKLEYNKTEDFIVYLEKIKINPFIAIIIQIIIVIILFFIYKILIKKIENKIVSISVCVLIWILLSATHLFPWKFMKYIPFLSNIQTSERILVFAFSFLIFIILDLILEMKDFNIIMICLLVSLIFMYPVTSRLVPSDEESKNIVLTYKDFKDLKNAEENTFFNVIAAEYIPLDFKIKGKNIETLNYKDFLSNKKPIFSEKTEYEYNRKNLITTISFKTSKKTDIFIPLVYYKGYKAYLNEEKIPIKEINGKIFIENVNSGTLVIKYEIQWFEYISAFISISFLIGLILFETLRYKKRH